MKLRTFTKPTRYIACPACGQGASQVDHLAPGCTFGPWYCDECGQGFSGRIVSADEVEVSVENTRRVNTVVTLRLEPEDAPVTLIVDGIHIVEGDEPVDLDGDDYFYNEHTCPTNFLPRVSAIIAKDGDDDPHGIFRWVKSDLASDESETQTLPQTQNPKSS